MPYTLTVWGLWMIGAAVIGLVIGWLLGRRGNPPVDDAPRPAAPATPATPEVERLRAKVAQLEGVAIERDRLEWELAEARSKALAAGASPAPAVFAPVVEDDGALAAMTAERDEWVAKAAAYEQVVGELRVRAWNAEAKVGELRQVVQTMQAASRAAAAPADAAPAATPVAPAAAAPAVAAAPATAAPPVAAPVASAGGGGPVAAPPPRPDLEAGEAVLGAPLRFDDLTVIEGIGPQIAQLCVARGIDSWWVMANTDPDRLRRMLAAAGPRFQVHDPSSWPEQGRLLATGDWAGFQRLTHALRGGRAGE